MKKPESVPRCPITCGFCKVSPKLHRKVLLIKKKISSIRDKDPKFTSLDRYWKPDPSLFTGFLSNPRLCCKFQLLLEKEHCNENLMFWKEGFQFQRNPTIHGAASIINTYVKTGSALEVNISSASRLKIMNVRLLEGLCIDPSFCTLFDDALKQVFQMLFEKWKKYEGEGRLKIYGTF